MRVLPAVEEHVFPTSTAGELYDLIVHVGEVAGTIVGRAKLIEIMQRGLRNGRRRGKVYLANGEEHEFVLGAEVRLAAQEMHRAVAPSSGSPTDLRRSECHSGSHQPRKLRTRCSRDSTPLRRQHVEVLGRCGQDLVSPICPTPANECAAS